ncbi:mitochondrial import protein Pam17 [Schizopora paradoxa]|uniref:Presequence translocated-associated motor subunit PAM17 n=1 Tax=Schizopora paradoxa TaxID=27342 RepID=A0A0H2RTM1_9AGAM|nr:mitochondrial import protein Pam17 [Schizopora paradoxa]
MTFFNKSLHSWRPRTCKNVLRDLRLRRNVSSPAPSAATAPSKQSVGTLTWPDYLAIRGQKRKWEMAATIPSIFIGFGAGAAYFGSRDIDATKPIFGFDPLYVYGFATMACGGLGYLIGPTIGSSFWRITHRRTMNLIEAKDREFHRRIVKNRVDPTAQSATNPVPDYYGERIGSLRQYRQWLRDQAKYKRKARWLAEE